MNVDEIKVCVLRIEGTNCEEEAYNAFKMLGASPEKVHLKQLIGDCSPSMRRARPSATASPICVRRTVSMM